MINNLWKERKELNRRREDKDRSRPERLLQQSSLTFDLGLKGLPAPEISPALVSVEVAALLPGRKVSSKSSGWISLQEVFQTVCLSVCLSLINK